MFLMTPKVEQVKPEDSPRDYTSLWILKRGKKAAKLERWEQQWYKRWGLSHECSICGEKHNAMLRQIDKDYKVSYTIMCPVASNETWPPNFDDGAERSIWESLEASPCKMAAHHCYSQEAVTGALKRWESQGAGNRMTSEDRELFKAEADLWCVLERQTWTFKRTTMSVLENDEMEEIDEEEG